MSIGERFKSLRKEFRLSQAEFGEKLKMTKSGISAVENDKVFVSVNVLRTLYFDFNVNINWFIIGEGEMFNAPKFEDVKDEILAEVDSVLAKYGIKKL